MPNLFTILLHTLSSATFGVILSMLIIFQWYKQYAKEQAVVNSLFAMRRKVERRKSQGIFPENPSDTLDDIDAVLATIGSRRPFSEELDKIFRQISRRRIHDESGELIEPAHENLHSPSSIPLPWMTNRFPVVATKKSDASKYNRNK